MPNAIVRGKADKRNYIADEFDNCTDFSSLYYRLPFERVKKTKSMSCCWLLICFRDYLQVGDLRDPSGTEPSNTRLGSILKIRDYSSLSLVLIYQLFKTDTIKLFLKNMNLRLVIARLHQNCVCLMNWPIYLEIKRDLCLNVCCLWILDIRLRISCLFWREKQYLEA